MWNLENKKIPSATKYTPERSKTIIRLPALRNTRSRSRNQIRHIVCPNQQGGGPRNPPTRLTSLGATREKPTHRKNDGPKTERSYPEQEASHHASLKEYGSLIDRGKWKPQQANKYGSRASCPITTSSSRIFMNKWAFYSKIIIKAIQTKESNN